MHPVAWIGFVAFFAVSLLVGVRLVALWRRTGELPELLIGVGVLGIGPVGFGLLTLGDALLRSGQPELARWLLAVANSAVAAGVFATCVFTWRVYHPSRRWARRLSWGIAGVLLSTLVGDALQTGFREIRLDSGSSVLRTATQVAILLWSAGESLRYWRMMRRRLRLGLADPLVTNRFFLWGLAAGAAGLGSAIGLAAQIATGRPPLEIGWLMLSSSLHGLVAAVAMWLAFLPLPFYRRLLESRARPIA